MKKIFCMVLSVAMMLNIFCVSTFAESSDAQLVVDQETEVTVVGNEWVSLTFTPKMSGYYTFVSSAESNIDPCCSLYGGSCDDIYDENYFFDEINYDDNSGEVNNFKVVNYLYANREYKYYVMLSKYATATFTVLLTMAGSPNALVLDQETEITIDGNYGKLSFVFTPEDDGYYIFESFADDSVDPYCNFAYNHNDNSGEGKNFKGIEYLSAGTEYICDVGLSDTATATFTILLTKLDLSKVNNLVLNQEADIQLEYSDGAKLVFIPEFDGYYTFESLSNNGTDTYCQLYLDGDGISSDDNSGEGSNFKIEEYLYADCIYIYGIYLWNRDSADITVMLSSDSVPDDNASQSGTTEDGFDYYIDKNEGYAYICGYSGDSKHLVFPSSIEGYPVTMLGCDGELFAWENKNNIESVTIPSTVTYIDYECYCGLVSNPLNSITVDSNNSVYDSRNDCNAIIETNSNTLIAGCKNTVIPEGVVAINAYAFELCEGLKSIAIPSSVTSISSVAFLGCHQLQKISVDKDNKVFDSRNDCNAIIETESNSLVLGISSTVIPDTITKIGQMAFSNSSVNALEIPDSVEHIEDMAFVGCYNISEIILPDSLKSIGYDVFAGCLNLAEITFLSKDCIIPDDEYALPDIIGFAPTAYYGQSDNTRITYYGYKDSTIQEYCEKYDRIFRIIKETPTIPEILLGDVNGDGEISIIDATIIQRAISKQVVLTEQQLTAADTDKDGEVSVIDATTIQRFVAKLIDRF